MIFKQELRGCDIHGCGDFGAARGERKHKGLDIRCFAGQEVHSPVAGKVTKIGFPYKQTDAKRKHFRYIEITVTELLKIRIFYVWNDAIVGDSVVEGEVIGFQQELGKVYEGIKEHVHLEVIIDKRHVDPMNFYETRCLS